MNDLATCGDVTLIVHTDDGIMEFTGPIPSGQVGRGYFNLMGATGFHGHLRHERCAGFAFSGFARQAEVRLDRLDAANSLKDLGLLRGNRLEPLHGDRRANTAFASMTNGEFASRGPPVRQARPMSRLRIIIEENTMARTPIHPGEHLAEELAELNMSAAELPRQIEVPVNRVTAIINGQRSITADTAIRLGHWFGTSPEFWLNLQKLYELRVAQAEIGKHVETLPRLSDRNPSDRHTSV
jgi:addiction module HigA family antidote